MFSISNSTTYFFVVKCAFPPAQDLRQLRCQAFAALLPQFLRHAVERFGDAAGDGGEGVAVAAEGHRCAQRVLKIAPYIRLPPPFLYVLVDAALPVGAERPGGADAAHRLADDLVIQRRASLVALVVHRAVSTDAEACRLLCRVDVCAEEQEFPAVSLLLPFNHAAHTLVIVAAAGVFVAVGGDDEHRLLRHILPTGVLVNVADVVDGTAHGVQQRRAAAGEKFVTLDGQERQLDENVLMICDAKKAVGIAGIMGGENSMITDHVTTMLFEAACFDGTNIRKSGKRIGLRTDASAKFEKGLDPNLAMEAMNRACQLVEELGVGEVVGGAVDIYPVKREGVKIPFEPDKYNKLLGTDIPAGDMIEYFKKIDLGYDEATNEILVPSWRQDLLCDADMAEEVARFYGYDKIGTSLPSGESTAGGKSFKLRMEEKAREIAEFCGFSQAMTYSFESPKVFDKLLIPEDSKWRKTVVISNPLGEDYSIMRTLPLNGMLTSLSTNFGRRNKDVRLYEMGNIYLPKQLPLTELPEERMQLTFGMYGDGDFFTMKGVIEELLYQTGLRKKAQYDPHAELPFLHPGRKAAIVYDGAVIGYLGEVHPTVAANYAIKERVYIAVIDMPEIVSRASFDYKYEGITNFPVSSRDLSMVVPKNILVGDIEKVFEENGGKYLENYELFDVYEGEQIEKGFKSVAYSLKFRGKDKNLEESDITGAMDKILSGLKNIGIQLRG